MKVVGAAGDYGVKEEGGGCGGGGRGGVGVGVLKSGP